MITAVFIIAFFFAMNIGASGAAASMGVAYAAGAIKNRLWALILCAIAVVLGSVIAGEKIIKTISGGITPSHIFTVEVVMMTLLACTCALFLANLLGIPISTSEVTVGAVVGVGIAYKALYIKNVLFIISFWFITPIGAFCLVYLFIKLLHFFEKKYTVHWLTNQSKWVAYFLVLAGCLEAFTAGMKNVANAVGPLVGANLISVNSGALYGGIFVGLGAILLGHRVLETNGKKITKFSMGEGIIVSLTSGILVMIAALYGIPLPIAQITSSGILGVGATKNGKKIFQKGIVLQMLKVWFVAPFLAMITAYSFVTLFLKQDGYDFFIVIVVCAATLGTISVLKSMKKEEESIQEEGSGI